jgi:hypothetical protein
MNDPGLTIVPPGPGGRSMLFTLAILAVMLFGFVHQAGVQIDKESPNAAKPMTREEKYRINLALMAHADQRADLESGLTERFTRWMPHRTDGETGPFWPWIMSRIVADGHPFQERAVMGEDYDLLRRGKWGHVWLTVLFLAFAGLIAGSSLSPPAAVLILLPATFSSLLPQAVSFQPDLLYFLLIFLCWICALRLLRRNSVWLHGIFGVLTGLAWLTDTTAWIVLAAWFTAACGRWLIAVLRRSDGPAEEPWTSRNHFVGLFAVAIGWIVVCAPRCGASMDRWGRPFFSWPQQWTWLDSMDRNNLLDWARAHDSREKLDAIPESERPSFSNYQRTHTPEQMKDRLATGWEREWSDFIDPAGRRRTEESSIWRTDLMATRGLYPAGALMLLAGAAVMALNRRKSADREGLKVPDGGFAGAMFTTLASAGFGVWYAWSAPVSHGGLTVIYLPLIFCLVSGAESLMILARMRGAPRSTWLTWQGLLWVLVAAAATGVILTIRSS